MSCQMGRDVITSVLGRQSVRGNTIDQYNVGRMVYDGTLTQGDHSRNALRVNKAKLYARGIGSPLRVGLFIRAVVGVLSIGTAAVNWRKSSAQRLSPAANLSICRREQL
jgi:hypothetical protein